MTSSCQCHRAPGGDSVLHGEMFVIRLFCDPNDGYVTSTSRLPRPHWLSTKLYPTILLLCGWRRHWKLGSEKLMVNRDVPDVGQSTRYVDRRINLRGLLIDDI